jgi:hypothetical protein
MSRTWNEFVAVLGDLMPGGVPLLALALLLVTTLVATLWFWWPAWLPSGSFRRRPSGRSRSDSSDGRHRFTLRWPRLGRLRWRWRRRWWRRRRPTPLRVLELPEDQVPDRPAAVLALGADELAAAGRYREAVRERLRAIVRDLIERQVLAPVPGWTVTELARAAGRARPATAPPLQAASDLFSEIWYGLRPATADDDRVMRERAEQVRDVLDALPVPGVAPAGHPAEVVR